MYDPEAMEKKAKGKGEEKDETKYRIAGCSSCRQKEFSSLQLAQIEVEVTRGKKFEEKKRRKEPRDPFSKRLAQIKRKRKSNNRGVKVETM